MPTAHIYLNFMGNTEEAFTFYKSVFGTEFKTFQRFKDTAAGANMTPADAEKIMHVALPVGGTTLMGTDMLESMGHEFKPGNNYSISLDAESEAEADKLFGALSSGGTVTMPLEKTFWGAYFGMITDRFGIQWMVNYDYPPQL